MTLTAFIDDSASEENDKLLVLAGYVHAAVSWEVFSNDWQKVLEAHPRIEYFKMREAESLKGEFSGWAPSTRDGKIDALAQVILRHKPWSVETYMSKAQYTAIVGPVVPYDIRHAYLDLFYALIIKLAQWHHSVGLRIPVNFVFDEQGQMGVDTAIWYGHIKSLQPTGVQELLGSTPIFRNDKKVLPLQAADLLAWHLRRQKEERNKDERRSIADKLFPLVHVCAELGDEYLGNIARDMSLVAKEMSEVAPHLGTLNKKKDSIMPALREALERERKKDQRK